MRQVVLQVTIRTPRDGDARRSGFANAPDGLYLPLDIDQRIVRRLITVRRRIRRRPLDVRIVVRRAGAKIDEFDTQLGTQGNKLSCLRQIVIDRVVRIDTETVPVRQAVGKVLRNAGAKFSGL